MKKVAASKPLETLVVIVLFLLVFGAIMFVIRVWYLGIDELTPKQICRQSVELAALSNSAGIDASADINCPTQYVEIKGRNQDSIKRKLANNMADCWWQFWEGEKELFSATPKTYCVICSVTEFEDKDETIIGFSKYLMETDVPGKNIRYADYFNGFKTSKAKEIVGEIDTETLGRLENERLETSKDYAVLFVYAKGKDEIAKRVKHYFMETPEGKAGAIAGGIAGVTGGVATVTAISFFVSNPGGWILGAGAIGGAVAFLLGEEVLYRLSSDNAPEWMSFVVFREYVPGVLQDLGCAELPAKQK